MQKRCEPMGRRGKRQKGSFAHDYDNHVMWNTHINLTDADLDEIADAGKVTLSAEQRLDLKAEIETYASLAEAERDAPAVGGSGRSNDFADQHYVNLAKIYQSAGGVISLGRRNPSKNTPRALLEAISCSLWLRSITSCLTRTEATNQKKSTTQKLM